MITSKIYFFGGSHMKKIRSLFLKGLFAILPLIITIYILFWFVTALDSFIGRVIVPITGISFPGMGLLFSIALILLTGFFISNYLGARLAYAGERILQRLPLVSKIYGGAKQIIGAFTMRDKRMFDKVVLVEYPRKNTFVLGFITGECQGEVQEKTSARLINVFIPTTPNPTSGMLILVPDDEIIYLDMSVEEGLKMIISAGVVVPEYKG